MEWNSRIVSNIHAVFGAVGGAYIIYTHRSWTSYEFYGSSDATLNILAISIAYFIYDLFLCLLNPVIRSKSTLLHHVMALGSVGSALLFHVCVYQLGFFLLTEITTPCVNQRYFFDKSNMKTSVWNVVNGLGMWLGFLVFRVYYATWGIARGLIWSWDEFHAYPWPLEALFLGIYGLITVLNSFWFYRISMGLVKAARGMMRSAPAPVSGAAVKASSSTAKGTKRV